MRRFDGEPEGDYMARRDRIVELITGFRKGRYLGDLGEQMEQELISLQDPGRTRRGQRLIVSAADRLAVN